MDEPAERLFAYGTLQHADVQRAIFGRVLDGEVDAVTGFRLDRIAINGPELVRESGETHYPVLVPDSQASQPVAGTLYWIMWRDLVAADRYEADEYERRFVTLASGEKAWVYVAASGLHME